MSMPENSEFAPTQRSSEPMPRKTAPQRFWDWLTSPSSELKDIGELRSARLAASFLFAIVTLIFMPLVIRTVRYGIQEAVSGGLGFVFMTTLFAYAISRTRWYQASIFLFTLIYSAAAYMAMVSRATEVNFSLLIFIYVPVALIVASSFLSWPFVLILTILNLGAFYATRYFNVPVTENFLVLAGITALIGIILILLTNFQNNTEKIRLTEIQETNRKLEELSSQLEQRVEERTHELVIASKETARRSEQLEAIAELARSLTDIQDTENLLPTIADFVSERLDYYHVGIFLNDKKGEYAVFRASNGESEGGQRMLARNHRLRIGSEGIVGYVVKNGEPRIALDVGADAVYFENPDLPNTHSEIALPLRLGTEFIGALDIQSTETNAFSDEDISVFITLADQIALAVQNTRLLTQAQVALQELEESYARQTGRDWQKFTKGQSIVGYHFDGKQAKPVQAQRKRKAKFDESMSLPINLRGQTIGKIKIKSTNKDRKWTEDELALIEAATNRAALALESARLLEDAQRRSSKEQAIGEASARIRETLDVEKVLETAAQELHKMLGKVETEIWLDAE